MLAAASALRSWVSASSAVHRSRAAAFEDMHNDSGHLLMWGLSSGSAAAGASLGRCGWG
jgi:hypothetical protein